MFRNLRARRAERRQAARAAAVDLDIALTVAALRRDFHADPDLASKYAATFMFVPEQANPVGEVGDLTALRAARNEVTR